jgi:hypothetical protein
LFFAAVDIFSTSIDVHIVEAVPVEEELASKLCCEGAEVGDFIGIDRLGDSVGVVLPVYDHHADVLGLVYGQHVKEFRCRGSVGV